MPVFVNNLDWTTKTAKPLCVGSIPTRASNFDQQLRPETRAVSAQGPDIDIPAGSTKNAPNHRSQSSNADGSKSRPRGVVLSRKYTEMKLINVAGAGELLREFGAIEGISNGILESCYQRCFVDSGLTI